MVGAALLCAQSMAFDSLGKRLQADIIVANLLLLIVRAFET